MISSANLGGISLTGCQRFKSTMPVLHFFIKSSESGNGDSIVKTRELFSEAGIERKRLHHQ